jgi:hypothetical protein
MSKQQIDLFSSIVDDKETTKTSQYSKIVSERISVKDALLLVHGGDPACIPPIRGSKE